MKTAQLERPAATPTIAREDVRDFYDRYYATLDDVRLEEWPGFFTETCLYRIIPRENFDRGLPLSTVRAESRGGLHDRVIGITKTQMYAPRYYRRFPGPLSLTPTSEGTAVRHNLLMMQTLRDKQPEVVLCATCHDELVLEGGELRLRTRDVVFDNEMIPNSLIYPA